MSNKLSNLLQDSCRSHAFADAADKFVHVRLPLFFEMAFELPVLIMNRAQYHNRAPARLQDCSQLCQIACQLALRAGWASLSYGTNVHFQPISNSRLS